MIQVEKLAKSYRKKEVLKEISFQVKPGERLAIVGPNGCGKSTLMQILAGIIKPSAGSLSYFGQNPLKDKRAFRKLCGYVPQGNPLMEELSVKDNLKLFGADSSILTDPLFASFCLEEIKGTTVSRLSGGMKRRVAIACAVAHMPPILFMDEPTAALDLNFKTSIHEWMQSYSKQGGILVLASHDQAEIALCQQAILIRNGFSEAVDPKAFLNNV